MAASFRLFLVRHAQSTGNSAGRFAGRLDLSLSEEGETQAREIGHRLARESVARIFSSPLARARLTAEAIREYSPVRPDVILLDDLIEADSGQATGLTWEEYAARFPDWTRRFEDGSDDMLIDRVWLEGETTRSVIERAKNALGRVLSEMRNAETTSVTMRPFERLRDAPEDDATVLPSWVIVSHSAVLCWLLALLQRDRLDHFPPYQPACGSISEAIVSVEQTRKARLIAIGQTSHLSGH